jgi:hypothetical protein
MRTTTSRRMPAAAAATGARVTHSLVLAVSCNSFCHKDETCVAVRE